MSTHTSPIRVRSLLGLSTVLTLAACGGGGDGGPVTPPPTVTITVTPTTSTVDAGGSTTFSATVANATNSAVTWSASGGTISGNGGTATWTAPFSGGSFTVTATSVAEPARSASATVTVRTVAISVSPDSAAVLSGGTGRFAATVSNSVTDGVSWSASGGTIIGDSTSRAVDWRAPVGGGTYTLTATSQADPTRTATVSVRVAPVAVVVSADSSSVVAGGTRTITAVVSGAADSTVTWTASGGAITGSRSPVMWTAPAIGGVYTVTATSVLDTSMHSSVSITVQGVTVGISAAPRAYFRGETASFIATLTGAAPGRDSVVWTSTCGPVSANGLSALLTAPATPGSCTVSVRSALDPTQVATTTLQVRSVWLVTSTDDTSDGACTLAHCSLREALLAANLAPDVDSIMLRETISTTATITLTRALPIIVTPMAHVGPGATQLTIQAAGSVSARRRVLTVRGSIAVTISGVTITGGYADEAGGLLVENGADVLLTQVTVKDNTASSGPGGGAAVYGGSALRVVSSLFEQNRSDDDDDGNGGAMYAGGQSQLHVTGGTVRANQANRGGGVAGEASGITLQDVTVENNTSARSGGGVSMRNAGTLTITGGVLRSNRSTESVGGALIAYATSFAPAQLVTVVMQDVRLENNTATQQGGAIQLTRNVNATLTRVVVDGNELTDAPTAFDGVYGAGIMAGQLVNLTIDQSTISNNRMLSTITTSAVDGGAGLMFWSDLSSSLTITNSTISGNQATVRGGGLHLLGAVTTTISNSTISGNSAPTGGGAMIASAVTLRNATGMSNRATVSGAGIQGNAGANIQIENTLLGANLRSGSGNNCALTGGATITSLGHNLSDDVSCTSLGTTGDITNTIVNAADLADNGGPTLTHALLVGSPAIDAANSVACSATDQRGVARVGACDIGAVEFAAGVAGRIAGRVMTPERAVFQRGAPRRMSTRQASAGGDNAARASSVPRR